MTSVGPRNFFSATHKIHCFHFPGRYKFLLRLSFGERIFLLALQLGKIYFEITLIKFIITLSLFKQVINLNLLVLSSFPQLILNSNFFLPFNTLTLLLLHNLRFPTPCLNTMFFKITIQTSIRTPNSLSLLTPNTLLLLEGLRDSSSEHFLTLLLSILKDELSLEGSFKNSLWIFRLVVDDLSFDVSIEIVFVLINLFLHFLKFFLKLSGLIVFLLPGNFSLRVKRFDFITKYSCCFFKIQFLFLFIVSHSLLLRVPSSYLIKNVIVSETLFLRSPYKFSLALLLLMRQMLSG